MRIKRFNTQTLIIALTIFSLFPSSVVLPREIDEVIIKAYSIGPTEPLWLNKNTVSYKVSTAIHYSPTQYLPGSLIYKKYDLNTGEKSSAKKSEYGIFLNDRKITIFTEKSGSFVIGQGYKDIKSHINVVNINTDKIKNIFSSFVEIMGVSIFLNGKSILFSHIGDLWVIDIEGSNLKQLTKTSKDREIYPKFNQVDRNIYFLKGLDIYRMNSQSTMVTQLTKNMKVVSSFSVSPDGRYLAFSSIMGIENPSDNSGNIWLLNLANNKVKKITESETDRFPDFSPDGKYIAFQRQIGYYAKSHIKEYQVAVKQLPKDLIFENQPIPCEEDCKKMFEKRQLKEGITIEKCIKMLCN